MILAFAGFSIFASQHRPHIFLWLLLRHPISFRGMPLMAYCIGSTLIVRDIIGKIDPEPWWLAPGVSITACLLSAYFVSLVIRRACEIMVIRFELSDPGKCLTCAFFKYGYRNSMGTSDEFPVPEHKCPQMSDSSVRKRLEDT